METANRILPSFVSRELAAATDYSFFQLNALLERYCEKFNQSHDEKIGLRYRAHAGLGFPASDISSLSWQERADQDGTQREFIELTVSFLGLYGPSSPLPAYYTERIIQAQDQQCPSRDLLDLFNHRLVTMLQSCWEKYRYYIQFSQDGADHYSRWLLAMAGLPESLLRSDSRLKWPRLLPFAGMLAGGCPTADAINNIVARYFDLTRIDLEPWAVREVMIQSTQCNRLGLSGSALGDDLLMGDSLLDCSGKFLLHLRQLSADRLPAFLPAGEAFYELVELVEFLLVDPLEFDLWLHPIRSDDKAGEEVDIVNELGWSLVLGEREPELNPEPIKICVSDFRSI